jgi:hypothetical protein
MKENYPIYQNWDIKDTRPAIIVGAGPSLDKDLAALSLVDSSECTIIATDAAIRVLRQTDINPEYGVTCEMDRQSTHPNATVWIDQHFNDIPEHWNGTLIAAHCASPLSVEKWGRDVLFYHNCDLLFSVFREHENLDDLLPKLHPRASIVGFHAIEFDLKDDHDYDRGYYHAWSWFNSFFGGKFDMNIINCSEAGRLVEGQTDVRCMNFINALKSCNVTTDNIE